MVLSIVKKYVVYVWSLYANNNWWWSEGMHEEHVVWIIFMTVDLAS